MIDFPASPTIGQTFTAAGVTWTYDGAKWTLGPSAPNLITVSDTPPPNPSQGALWWESVNGQMYVFYTDANSSQWVPTTNQMGGGYMPLMGVTDGSDAKPGQIGEFISSNVTTPFTLTTSGQQYNLTSISLTPGDWDVFGEVWIQISTVTSSAAIAAIHTVSAAIPSAVALNTARAQVVAASNTLGGGGEDLTMACRASLSAPTTSYYLNIQCNFTAGPITATGKIWARRVR